ncbi:hypothetical protein CBR_g66661 [Chara braunii]|uniref:Uncharacterized protein n=1 Tax=Chara braunii TaxID=69332 RepID=A0A388JPX4_CHABU|nr:hypothetical protein CBR_g66661 [Chara braunii]|eukprot:GBG59854.1 hypothetical protein CBR_g66661 [Chara braunii]
MLQRDTHGLSSENTELKHRLRQMEHQAQLRDAFNEALRDEVQRLKMATAQGAATVAGVGSQGSQGLSNSTDPASIALGAHLSVAHPHLHLSSHAIQHQLQQHIHQQQQQQQHQQQHQQHAPHHHHAAPQEHLAAPEQGPMVMQNSSSHLSSNHHHHHHQQQPATSLPTVQSIKKEQAEFLAVHAASFGTLAALSGSSFMKPDDTAAVPVPQGSGSYG